MMLKIVTGTMMMTTVYDCGFDSDDDDGYVDDRDVNLCRLTMRRQTTWSVFGNSI